MVREQEPAHTPSALPQTGTQSTQPAHSGTAISNFQRHDATQAQNRTTIDLTASPQPVFGRPTAIGSSSPIASRYQSSQRTANLGPQRRANEGSRDQYSNLFISAKSSTGRPDLHKPTAGGNPLLQLHRPPKGGNPLQKVDGQQTQRDEEKSDNDDFSRKTIAPGARLINRNDDVFEIPKPANFPSWQPKPISYPTFSSHTGTNSAFQPRTQFIDLTSTKSAPTSNDIWDDRYGVSDPHTFLDSATANEQLKSLFEGAMEDEDDKPRTRGKTKQAQAKVDELAEQLNNMKVKSDKAENEEEEAEVEEDDGTVEGLKVKLLPHQIEGVEWMRSKELGKKNGKGKTSGGILADDMGLGKTIQSISLILTNRRSMLTADDSKKPEYTSDKGTLVVAPLALIKQWEGEIQDRVEKDHALTVCVHHGPKRTKSYKDLKKYDVVITTYSTLSSEHAASTPDLPVGCFGVKWFRIILDEAHSIKNRNAKATKAACALNARFRWCLSGTPMQNNLDELQSLIHFLRIAPLDKLDYWRDYISRPMSSGRGGLAIKRLQSVLRNIMKRRTKDVLKQNGRLNGEEQGDETGKSNFKLVKRTVESIEAEFTKQERLFYERLESRTDERLEMMRAGDKMSYASALVLLMRLRQACNHPQLIGGDLMKDAGGLGDGGQTPRKKASVAQYDTDDLAAMLGGLSVEMKLCDVCQVERTKEEMREGALRCGECERDVVEQGMIGKSKHQKMRDKKALVKSDRKVARRVILDSDDEDSLEQSNVSKHVDLSTNDNDNDDSDDDDDQDNTTISSDPDDDDEDYNSDDFSPTSDLITSTKIRHLLNILRSDSHNHKYIVFSVFTSMLDLIEPFLASSHIRYTRYDGSMRPDAREASLLSLRSDPTTRVLLCSLRAGSLGLNLTAASRVVILEPFWNPFVEEQAIDRVHRLNQTVDVVVYKMTIKDTVESRILALQEKKRELAQATVEGGLKNGKEGVGKLSMADMLKLFDHGAEREAKVDMLGMREGGLLGVIDGDANGISTWKEQDERNRGKIKKGWYTQEEWDELGRQGKLAEPPKKQKKYVPDVYSRRW